MPNAAIAAAFVVSVVLLAMTAASQAADTECVGALTGTFESIVVPIDANVVGDRVRCRDNERFIGGPNEAPCREGQCF